MVSRGLSRGTLASQRCGENQPVQARKQRGRENEPRGIALPQANSHGGQHQERESTCSEAQCRWPPEAHEQAAGPQQLERTREDAQAVKAEATELLPHVGPHEAADSGGHEEHARHEGEQRREGHLRGARRQPRDEEREPEEHERWYVLGERVPRTEVEDLSGHHERRHEQRGNHHGDRPED